MEMPTRRRTAYLYDVVSEQCVIHGAGPVLEVLSRIDVLYHVWRDLPGTPTQFKAVQHYVPEELEELPARWWEMSPEARTPPAPCHMTNRMAPLDPRRRVARRPYPSSSAMTSQANN